MKDEKNIKLLLLGRGISEFGYSMYLISFPLFILTKTNSLKEMGIFFSFSTLPAIILAPFLGSYIEKLNKKMKNYGFSGTFLGIGSILASSYIFINNKFSLLKNLKFLFILNSSLMIIIGILSLIIPLEYKNFYFLIFLILQFLIGIITTFINVPLISFFQKNVNIEYQSRFFSILSFFSGLLVPAGILYAGFLSNTIGADKAYILNNFIIILIVIFVMKKKEKIE